MQLTARIRAADTEKGVNIENSNDTSKMKSRIGVGEDNSKQFRKHKTSNVLAGCIGRLKYQWSLLSPTSKVASVAVLVYFLQHVLLGIWDQRFHQIGGAAAAASFESKEQSFAVVINTYKRPDRLREAVQHYANTCGRRAGVSQVFIVWCEPGATVPDPQSFFDDNNNNNNIRSSSFNQQQTNTKNRAQVQILQKANSLNSRFEPIDALQSTSVFMVDDDVRVSCPTLLLAFDAWKAHPDTMVGYYPRLASPPLKRITPDTTTTTTTELVYHPWPIVFWRHSFNFVLTKASFLHSKYLDLYTHQYIQSIKDHVDQHMNCEDIAMSMLVANYTKSRSPRGTPDSPIYVEGSVIDRGIIGGISSGTGHMSTRSECLTKLTAIFKDHGWGSPLEYQVPLGENSWIQHAPGFWWQYRPSSFFEWLAFANTFT
jgi:hypothetical protein